MSNRIPLAPGANPMMVATRELVRGERLIWADYALRRRLSIGDLPQILFGLFFAGFALLWISGAYVATSVADEPGVFRFFFPLFGLPFLLVGIGVAGAPLWKAAMGGPTVYALTDRRVLAISGRQFQHLLAADIGTLSGMARTERSDGSGDILFNDALPGVPAFLREAAFGPRGSIAPAAFRGMFAVPDVRRVADHIERMRRESVDRGPVPPESNVGSAAGR